MKKREIIQFRIEDRMMFEDHLNDMSKQGWNFSEMDLFSITYEKSNECKYYYVDLYEKIPFHHSDYSKEERQKQIDLYGEMGLKLKHIFHHYMIYESDFYILIRSDEIIEKNLIEKTKKRQLNYMSSKHIMFYGIFIIFAFLSESLLEKMSLIYVIPLSILCLTYLILLYKKEKEIEEKKEKTIQDMIIRGYSYLSVFIALFVFTALPILITSENIFTGFIEYIRTFNSVVTMLFIYIVGSKYDANYMGKRFIIFVIFYSILFWMIIIFGK